MEQSRLASLVIGMGLGHVYGSLTTQKPAGEGYEKRMFCGEEGRFRGGLERAEVNTALKSLGQCLIKPEKRRPARHTVCFPSRHSHGAGGRGCHSPMPASATQGTRGRRTLLYAAPRSHTNGIPDPGDGVRRTCHPTHGGG